MIHWTILRSDVITTLAPFPYTYRMWVPSTYRQAYRICPLLWRHNGCQSVSNHQPHDCLLNRLFRRRSKKTSKLRVTGLCAGNSPETGEFPAQMASNAENVSIRWRHHACRMLYISLFCFTLPVLWIQIIPIYKTVPLKLGNRNRMPDWFEVCLQPIRDGVTL